MTPDATRFQPADVLLVVEVESPSSRRMDRLTKPSCLRGGRHPGVLAGLPRRAGGADHRGLRAGGGRLPGGRDGAGGGVEARGRAVPGGAAAGRAGRPETEGLSWLGSRRARRRHRWCSGSGCGTRSGAGCGSPRTGTSRAPSSGRCGAAAVPMAYSAGFSPHPKVSYVGAAPTGVASEAEYLEIGLAAVGRRASGCGTCWTPRCRPGWTCWSAWRPGRAAAGWPTGSTRAPGGSSCPGVPVAAAEAAVAAFLDRAEVQVERLTKDGRRLLDARAAGGHRHRGRAAGRGGRALCDT